MTGDDREEAEALRQWETWGVIEIAVRNPNVSSYMDHWEGRATKAEEENERLRAEVQNDYKALWEADSEENERLRAALVVAETNLERLEFALRGEWPKREVFPISEWRKAIVAALTGEGSNDAE